MNQLIGILTNYTSLHHISITADNVVNDYIISNIVFERPPLLYIEKMHAHRDEQNMVEVINYDNIQRLEIIGQDKTVLFEWTDDLKK